VGRRLTTVALVVLSLAVVPSAQSAYGEHVLGPQRILVALVTWGPQPFGREDVRRIVFDQVDELYRSMSYGKASLTGAVTPWLKAFAGPSGCSLPPVKAAASAAAFAAGYDPMKYDRVVYIHPDAGCPWSGVTLAATVFLNGAVTMHLVAHELGHSFGLGHANLTDCRKHGCGALEYGDPYDTMGAGSGDFSAKAKFELGWLTRVTRVARNGTYGLAPIEQTSSAPQAFVVTTANDQYWIEYRGRPAQNDDGQQTAGAGVIVRVSPSPDLHDFGSTSIPNLSGATARRALRRSRSVQPDRVEVVGLDGAASVQMDGRDGARRAAGHGGRGRRPPAGHPRRSPGEWQRGCALRDLARRQGAGQPRKRRDRCASAGRQATSRHAHRQGRRLRSRRQTQRSRRSPRACALRR
jgi:hypothetical protein